MNLTRIESIGRITQTHRESERAKTMEESEPSIASHLFGLESIFERLSAPHILSVSCCTTKLDLIELRKTK